MVDILKEFTKYPESDVYTYGKVINVSLGGIVSVRTTTDILLKIKDTQQSYSIGDSVILGTNDENLNNAFIIRKINRTVPSSINYTINFDQG